MLAIYLSAISFIIVIIIAAVGYFCYYRKGTSRTNHDDMIYIRLHAFEDRLLLSGGRMVTTLTWYRGDHVRTASYLQERLDRILVLNPWLTGTIQRRRRWYLFGPNYLVYRKSTASSTLKEKKRLPHDLFVHLSPSESPLTRFDTPMEEVSDIVREHDLSCLPDYHHPLYRVAIVPCSKSPTTHFAVIISMSHIAGDAHTYYALYNALMNFPPNGLPESSLPSLPMVSENDKIVSSGLSTLDKSGEDSNNTEACSTIPILTVQRVPEFSNDVKHAMGSRRDSTLSTSFSLIIPSALSMIYGKLRNVCSPTNQYKIQRRYIRIDQDKINILKRDAAQTFQLQGQQHDKNNATNGENNAPPTFCSLNDVVTSWLMMNSKCRHGFMAMNMRNRKLHQHRAIIDTALCNVKDQIEIYPYSLAGNYINFLYYQIPKHCSTPIFIRQSLSTLRRVETPSSRSIRSKTPSTNNTNPTTGTTTPSSAPLFLFGGTIIVTNWCSVRAISSSTEPTLNSAATTTTKTSDGNNDLSSTTSWIIHEEMHYPLYTYQVDTHPYNTITAILYLEKSSNMNGIASSGTNQIGLMLCGIPSKLDTLIQSCPFVGSTSVA